MAQEEPGEPGKRLTRRYSNVTKTVNEFSSMLEKNETEYQQALARLEKKDETIAKLTAEIEDLRKQAEANRQLRIDHNECNAKQTELRSQKEKLELEVSQTKAQLQRVTNSLLEIQKQGQQFKDERCKELERRIEALSKENVTLTSRLDEARLGWEAHKGEILRVHASTIEQLKADIERKLASLNSASNQRLALQSQLEEAKSTIHVLEDQLSNLKNEYNRDVQSLNERLQIAEENATTFEAKYNELQQARDEREAAISAYEKKFEASQKEVQDLTKVVEEQRKQIVQCEDALKVKENKIGALQRQFDDKCKLHAQSEASHRETRVLLEAKSKEVEKLCELLKEAEARLEAETKTLTGERTNLQQQLVDQQNTRVKLEAGAKEAEEKLKEKLTQLKSELATMKAAKESVERNLEKTQEEYKKLNSKYETALKWQSNLSTELDENNKKITTLTQELTSVKAQYNSELTRVAELEKRHETAQEEKYQLSSKLQNTATENEKLKASLSKLTAQNGEILAKFNAQQKSIETLTSARDSLQVRLDDSTDRVSQLVERLKEANVSLTTTASQVKRYQSEANELEKELAKEKESRERLEHRLLQVQGELDKKTSMVQEISKQFKEELDKVAILTQQVTQLLADRDSAQQQAKDSLKEMGRLLKERDELMNRVKVAEAENEKNLTQIEALVQDMLKSTQELADYRIREPEIEKEREWFRSSAQQFHDQQKQLLERVAELERQLAKATDERVRAQAQVAELTNQLIDSQNELNLSRERYDKLYEDYQLQITRINDLTKAYETLKNQYASLKKENEELKSTISDLKSQLIGVRHERDKLMLKLKETQEALDNALKRLSEATEKIDTLSQEVIDLTNRITVLTDENAELKKQLQAIVGPVTIEPTPGRPSYVIRPDALNKQVEALKLEVQKLRDELAAEIAVRVEAEKRATDATNKLETAITELETVRRLLLSERNAHGIELERLRTLVNTITNERDEARSALPALRLDYAALQKQMTLLSLQNKSLNEKIDGLNLQIIETQKERTRLAVEVTQTRENYNVSQRELTEQRHLSMLLRAERDKQTKLAENVTELYKNASQDLNGIKQELTKLIAERVEYFTRSEKLATLNDQLYEDLANLRKKASALEAELETNKIQFSQLKQSSDGAKTELSALKQQPPDSTAEKRFEDIISNLQVLLTQSEAKLSRATMETEQIRSKYSSLEKEYQIALTELEVLRRQATDLNISVEAQQQQTQELSKEFMASQRRVTELKNQITTLRDKTNVQDENVETWREKYEKTSQALDAALQHLAQADKMAKRAQERYQDVKSRLDTTTAKLQQLQQEFNEVSFPNQQYKEHFNSTVAELEQAKQQVEQLSPLPNKMTQLFTELEGLRSHPDITQITDVTLLHERIAQLNQELLDEQKTRMAFQTRLERLLSNPQSPPRTPTGTPLSRSTPGSARGLFGSGQRAGGKKRVLVIKDSPLEGNRDTKRARKDPPESPTTTSGPKQ